jgi:O-antigen/teichoic acid export membrane protein
MSAANRWNRSARRGVLWSTIAFAGSKVFAFLATLVLARLLVPAEFGVVAAIVIFLALLEIASSMGLGAAVIYEQEEGVTSRLQTAFTANLLLAVALTGLAVALAPLVAAFFHVPESTDLFRLASLTLLLGSLGTIPDALLLRELDFRRRSLPQVLRALVRGAVAIVLALADFGAASLVWGMLAGTLVSTGLQFALARFRPTLRLDLGELRSMASYGAGAVALEALSLVAGRSDAAIIGRVLGEGALGLYTVAFRLPELLIDNMAWNVSIVAFPALARHRTQEERGMARTTLEILRYQAVYALPVAAALAVLAPPLVIVLFGEAWAGAGPVMSAVAVLSGITALVFPLGDVFKAMGRQRTLVALNLAQLPIAIATIILLAPHGIVAVAWARVAGMLIHGAFVLMIIAGLLRIRRRAVTGAAVPGLLTAAGVALGAGVVRLLWDRAAVLPLLAAALAGAALGLLVLRAFAPAILRELRETLRRRRRRAHGPAAPTSAA